VGAEIDRTGEIDVALAIDIHKRLAGIFADVPRRKPWPGLRSIE
jgi:hypothetical protein